jgi:Ni,Fe-hydrogenase I cytochrome b subunit
MKKVFLHTLTIRIWHWINALIVIALMITGIQLRVPRKSCMARSIAIGERTQWVGDIRTVWIPCTSGKSTPVITPMSW